MLSAGGVIKGCNKPALNQYDRELQCMSKEPTCPSSGIMAFYSIIVNEVYNRRELYFGPRARTRTWSHSLAGLPTTSIW